MSTLRPDGVEVELRHADRGGPHRDRVPGLLHRGEPEGRRSTASIVAVSPDAALIGGVLLVLCAIGFFALWKRKRTLLAFVLFLTGFAFDAIHPALRLRLHLPRWLSPAPGLAHQQVRDDRLQGDPTGGRGPAPGTPAQGGRGTVELEVGLHPRRARSHRRPASATRPSRRPRKKIPKPTE